MFRGFGAAFENDPFFRAHHEQMREMDRMMDSFGRFDSFGFGFPFGNSFGMLEGPEGRGVRNNRGERNNHGERGIVQRERHRDPFQSMFDNMNSMMSQMHQNFDGGHVNPNGFSYSSSQVMTYSNDGRNPPKYFEASSSTKHAPGGVKETKKSVRDSESGLHRMAIGHHIGDRGHVIEKSRNTKTENEEQKQDFFGMEEEDASAFDREFKEKTRNFARHRELGGLDDIRPRHHGDRRSRNSPALDNRSHHREREGRARHHEARKDKPQKTKKVKVVEPDSHL